MRKLYVTIALIFGFSSGYGLISLSIVTDTVCPNFPNNITSTSTATGNIISYMWDLDNDGQFDDGFSSNITNVLNYSSSVFVGLKIITDSPEADSAYFNIPFRKAPNAMFTVNNLCLGTISQFNNQSTITGSDNLSYAWDFSDGNTSVNANPVHTYQSTGDFNPSLIVSSSYNCTDTFSHSLKVHPLPNVEIILIGDEVICDNNISTLAAQSEVTYFWSTGESNSNINISEPGWYYLVGTDSLSCVGRDSVEIILASNPELSVSNDTFLVAGEAVPISASGADSYIWFPSSSLSSGTSQTTTANPTATTIYEVTGSNTFGCTTTKKIKVTVYEKYFIDYTNAITPNADGLNDFFIIRNKHMFKECPLTIYNQLGNEVYSNNNYQNEWNGTFNGMELPSDTYYFSLKCQNQNNSFTGAITLIR